MSGGGCLSGAAEATSVPTRFHGTRVDDGGLPELCDGLAGRAGRAHEDGRPSTGRRETEMETSVYWPLLGLLLPHLGLA